MTKIEFVVIFWKQKKHENIVIVIIGTGIIKGKKTL